ncbi:MAG: GHKL domain-containing protein [Lachnospiraceae bacterium]|nr:GHKL domain-containing protein [Lachnospiraceae bacterium]
MSIILALAEIFTVVMQQNVCKRVFDKKKKSAAVYAAVWIAFYVICNAATYFFTLLPYINMLIFAVLFFGVLSFLYEGTIKNRLVLVVFLYLLGMLSEVIVYFAALLCGIDLLRMAQNTEMLLMYTVLSKLIWFVEIKLALLFLKKNKNMPIYGMDWLEVFMVPLGSIFIVAAIFVPQGESYIWMKLAASILVLIINLFAFYNYNEMQEKALYRAKQQFLTQQIQSYAAQLREMSGAWQQAAHYRHDLKQRYLLIDSYLNNNEYEKIRELYRQSIDIPTDGENICKTGNVSFDTIVNYKAAAAKKHGIEVDLHMIVPCDAHMDDVDLYSLLGNLFDNAIEAAAGVTPERRKISLTAKMSGNNLYLEMKNPYAGDLKKQGDNYLTTKENPKEHGLGLRIIENIVNRHSGQMIIDDKEQCFRVKLLLYDIEKNRLR